MRNARRDFLGWLGASALLSTAASPLSGSEVTERAPRALDDKFDMSWTDKLTGKYRAVFDSPAVSEGAGRKEVDQCQSDACFTSGHACNLAFGDVVGSFMKAEKLKQNEARKRALAQLMPGVILQPSGVFAALRAQAGGCHYILAS